MKKQINFCKRTLIKGLAFSAIDLREERASPEFTAVEVRPEGAGAKAAADPIKRRESFMVVGSIDKTRCIVNREMRVPFQKLAS